MTVCAAAIFSWIYNLETMEMGTAILAVADRMLTDEGLGIAYESHRFKASIVGKRLILVSGPIFVHSHLLRKLHRTVDVDKLSTEELANRYASLLRDYSRQQASDAYLAPLGLTVEKFNEEQRRLEPALAADLANQLQHFRIDGEPEAIIAGFDENSANLYHVNRTGVVTCHDDIGFLSIGNGGIHATGHLMVQGHSYRHLYSRALLTLYAAKKRAEVSPGVGKLTDVFLLTQDSVERLDDRIVSELERRYQDRMAAAQVDDIADAEGLGQFIGHLFQASDDERNELETPNVMEQLTDKLQSDQPVTDKAANPQGPASTSDA